jgi:hypothetical protein
VESCCECGDELSGFIKCWKPRPSPEDGNRSRFRNAVLSSYLYFQTMDIVLDPSDPGRYTPSLEKKTPWSESASELYRPRDHRLSAK